MRPFKLIATLVVAMLFFAMTLGAQTNAISFRVMTFNIHHAEGLDGSINTQRIADLINAERADLVGLQEVDVGTTRVQGRNLIAELAQQTGMNYVFSNNLNFQGGQYGNGILSRFPIKFRDHRLLPKVGASEQRGWLKAVVDINGNDLSFWVTHLDNRSTNAERLACVTNFNAWLLQETVPVLFVGDFNDTPNSAVYNQMNSQWDDAWTLAGAGSGYTIPSDFPVRRIDFLWIPHNAQVHPVESHVPASTASDHRPVVTEVSYMVTNTNQPIAVYFPFNEGNGTNVSDSTHIMYGNFGSPAPVWTNDTPAGAAAGDAALSFNGTARVTVPDPVHIIGLSGTNTDYTLQAWVKLPSGFNPAARMIMFQNEGFPGFSFSINTGRTLHTTTFTIKDINSTAVVPNDNQWHHVAVVHEEGVEMRFYIDALLASSVAYTNGPGNRTSYTFTIGGAAGGANLFTGMLDRVRYAPRGLSETELDFPATPPLKLQLRKAGNSLVIFWPAAQTGYILESSTTLSTPGWSFVPYTTQGTENQALVSPSGGSRFYRLRK